MMRTIIVIAALLALAALVAPFVEMVIACGGDCRASLGG